MEQIKEQADMTERQSSRFLQLPQHILVHIINFGDEKGCLASSLASFPYHLPLSLVLRLMSSLFCLPFRSRLPCLILSE
jgi:hypothetical protein